MHLDKQFC